MQFIIVVDGCIVVISIAFVAVDVVVVVAAAAAAAAVFVCVVFRILTTLLCSRQKATTT